MKLLQDNTSIIYSTIISDVSPDCSRNSKVASGKKKFSIMFGLFAKAGQFHPRWGHRDRWPESGTYGHVIHDSIILTKNLFTEAYCCKLSKTLNQCNLDTQFNDIFYRTEYWKSNARKYCEFCKCWLADNKISISYHENGKRHKESVQQHIAQLTKKSAKEHKQQMKIDDDMKKMEEAAMAAYVKDVQNNADLTSQTLNKILDSKAKDNTTSANAGPSVSVEPTSDWLEVRAEDGNIYYWNQSSDETTWEPPDKYISLDEQDRQAKGKKLLQKSNERLEKAKQIEKAAELSAFMKREKMKGKKAKEEKTSLEKSDTFTTGPVCGPAPRANPYGTWAPIPEKIEEHVDLQLPQTDKQNVYAPVIIEPEIIKFKERKVDSLGEGQVDFKKRKLNSNIRRNIRKKDDDND